MGIDRDTLGISVRLDPRPNPDGGYWIIAGRAHACEKTKNGQLPRYTAHDCSSPCPDFRSQFGNDSGESIDSDDPGF